MEGRPGALLVLALSLVLVSWWTDGAGAGGPAAAFVGQWSAPSLSEAGVPIRIEILPDGTATERVGNYRGKGTWAPGDGAVRIFWDSGWTGLLRRTATGAYEFLTWRPDTPDDGPADDTQPANRRVDP